MSDDGFDTFYRINNETWQVPLKRDEGTVDASLSDDKKGDLYDEEPDELWIRAPYNDVPGRAHDVAMMALQALIKSNGQELTKEWLNKVHRFSVIDSSPELNGNYEISPQKEAFSLKEFVKQSIPMFFKIKNNKAIVVDVKKTEGILSDSAKKATFIFEGVFPSSNFDFHFNPAEPFSERIQRKPFEDPFSVKTKEYLQKMETHFISHAANQSDYQFSRKSDGRLTLSPLSSRPTQEQKRQNREIVQEYYDYVMSEYGPKYLNYIQATYGFDFHEMRKEGSPLLPEHVYKVNIGVNSIEVNDIERIYQNLKNLQVNLQGLQQNQSLALLWDCDESSCLKTLFSLRELRGLIKLSDKRFQGGISGMPTVGEFKAFIDEFLGEHPPRSVEDLDARHLNDLIGLLMLPPNERSVIFAGREIKHVAICGYHTLCNRDEWNPANDAHELLQIFSDIQTTNIPDKGNPTFWNGFVDKEMDNLLEILTHVACKKHLFRSYSIQSEAKSKEWNVGLLIPGLRNEKGEQGWYYVKHVLDDNSGDFNYFLVPASKDFRRHGKPLPCIKLFRSTASNKETLNGDKSVIADLNPHGSPNTLNPGIADEYGMPSLFERTIPTWMGYLLYAEKKSFSSDSIKEYFKEYLTALAEFEIYINDSKRVPSEDQAIEKDLYERNLIEAKNELAKLKQITHLGHPETEFEMKSQADALKKFLIHAGHLMMELPEYKTQQDIIFAGHSLGAAIAQFGMYYFFAKGGRIPCPGNHLCCYELNPPGIDKDYNEAFMAFGRAHQDMLKQLDSKASVFGRFEWGDVVGASGVVHLTSGLKPEDKDWLKVSMQVFKPKWNTKVLGLMTMPTHDRMIGSARLERDYALTDLKPETIAAFDNSYFLHGRMNKLFGLTFRMSAEMFRRTISNMDFVYRYLRKGGENSHPANVSRDPKGVFFEEYKEGNVVQSASSKFN